MPLEVIITDWAFQSDVDLKAANVFTPQEYKTTLRPDVELLKTAFPNDPRFNNSHRGEGAKLKRVG